MDTDTSSYLKPTVSPPVLDQVSKYGALEQQKIGIDQSKLELMNKQFGLINQELATIAQNPNATKEDAAKRLNTFADTHSLPPQVRQHMMGELQAAPDAVSFAKNALARGMDTQQRINKTYGVNGGISNGQQFQPTITKTGEAPQPVGQPIQTNLPVGNVEYDDNGQPKFTGPQNPQLPPGNRQVKGGIPGQYEPIPQNKLPVAPGPITDPAIQGQSNNFGGNVVSAVAEPPTFNQRVPTGPKAGPSPMFDEGKAQLVADQNIATQKMTAVKPAIQALTLLNGLRSGPGTETYNKAIAGLKANGILTTAKENDPTAVYQEVSKKLAQYVSGNPAGQRSDAGQALAEAASPSPKTQINPALIKLTRDAIILDRVEAARPNAFKGNDYSKYGQHRSTFPQSIDERAFGLDLMAINGEDSSKLVKDMAKKLESDKPTEKAEATKFFKSLQIAKDQGFYSSGK